MAHRIEQHVQRGKPVELTVDGEAVRAWEGETIASVLLLRGHTNFYRSRSGAPRAPFCNMGACFECRVDIKQGGRHRWVLACMTPVQTGMTVLTGQPLPWMETAPDAN